MNKIIVKDNMYNNDLILYVNCTGKEIGDEIREKYKIAEFKDPTADGAYSNVEQVNTETHKHKYLRFIWISSFNWTVVEQGLLIHELLHFVFDSLKILGIKYCEESEEVYTYYLQHILMQCYQELKKIHPKYKKNVSGNKSARSHKRIKGLEKSKK